MAERPIEVSYVTMTFHESYTYNGGIDVAWDHKFLLIQHKLCNLDYMTTEDDTSGNFGRPFWKNSLFCNSLNKVC